MLVYKCDRCGKACKQVLHVAVKLMSCGYVEPWSDRNVDGDYCQECFDEIAAVAKAGDENADGG